MSRDALSHITTWVFDLDHTLYPPQANLFGLIEPRITNWIMEHLHLTLPQANHLRDAYWRRYGATLTGLMREHGLDPVPYLAYVHDISMESLTPDPALANRIRGLPGRRIVYTNGSAPYAERVLAARGLLGLFDAIYGVEHAQFQPKPERAAFDTIFAMDGLSPTKAAMFEDDPRNLIAPHEMGLATVHVAPSRGKGHHIHHHTNDLTGFLSHLGTAPLPPPSSSTGIRL